MIGSVLLAVALIGWGVLCGVALFEAVAMTPVWGAAPPESLVMWRGEHRIRSERFWVPVHPVLVLLLAATTVAVWEDAVVRTLLAATLGVYLVIIVVTALYFVPELMRLTRSPDGAMSPGEWRRRAVTWERAGWVRSAALLVIAGMLVAAMVRH